MTKKIFFLINFFYFFVLPSQLISQNQEIQETEEILHKSNLTIDKLLKNKDLRNLKDYLKKSKAVLIFPDIYEGSFLFGAKGGNGILFIRHSDGWSGPFFYSIGGASIGLQFGIKSGNVIMTIMSARGLRSILNERIKIGVDIDAAVADQGVGFSAESTLRLADIFTFSDNSGLFLGGSFEGTYLQPRNDLNSLLYGFELTPDEVLTSTKLHEIGNDISNILSSIK